MQKSEVPSRSRPNPSLQGLPSVPSPSDDPPKVDERSLERMNRVSTSTQGPNALPPRVLPPVVKPNPTRSDRTSLDARTSDGTSSQGIAPSAWPKMAPANPPEALPTREKPTGQGAERNHESEILAKQAPSCEQTVANEQTLDDEQTVDDVPMASELTVASEPVQVPIQGPDQIPIQESVQPLASVSTGGASVDSPAPSIAVTAVESSASKSPTRSRRFYMWPIWFLGRIWDFTSLVVLLAVVAAIPVLQLASLGYLLVAASNLADRRPWRDALPGLRLAGKIGTFSLLVTLAWLPVYLVTDLAYSAQLLQPGSGIATGWRLGAFLISGAWILHVAWAAMRGGRWWHLMWPAPLAFAKRIWRPATWRNASDNLYEFVSALRFPQLWWLGARAAVGALLWIAFPVSLMIIGLRSQNFDPAGLVGLIGATLMTLVMLYLPFLQVQMARKNRFWTLFDVPSIRRGFKFSPWAHSLALFMLCLLSIPLYLLRIEATPSQLVWAPALVFVLFMLPAKILIGAAMGYGESRSTSGKARRHRFLRWTARIVGLASVLIYVGALYVAQLVASQGAYVMYFQHAFLVPAPLIGS